MRNFYDDMADALVLFLVIVGGVVLMIVVMNIVNHL